MLKSLELAFRGSSFQNFPGGEYPRTCLDRSHLQRSYVLPPNFEFFPKPLYYELYCTDHCIKWAFKTWKYRFSVSKFLKIRETYIPGIPHFRVCPPHFLERIVALDCFFARKNECRNFQHSLFLNICVGRIMWKNKTIFRDGFPEQYDESNHVCIYSSFN